MRGSPPTSPPASIPLGGIIAVDISQAMLDKLAEKPELEGKVEVFCQDILEAPLDRQVDLIVSAMAMHHIEDTRALLSTLFQHLAPGGRIAIADLDAEDGDFHPADIAGVFHAGFDRDALAVLLDEAGFGDARFATACELDKEGKRYPVFLMMATRPA